MTEGKQDMTFVEMLATVLRESEVKRSTFAAGLGVSPQYFSDLEHGRRLPSVSVVNKICAYMGRGPKGRLEWHRAGARAHGWEI